MPEVLDYSGGYPAPAAIRAAGYVGVVRYIGTPGRPKNLTRSEAQQMRTAGVPIGLVYEATAGWMRGGAAAGAGAARAALADAAACGVEVRCVYLACDEDVTTQMASVMACLDGAATVLGRPRTGVYGEADVIDAALPGHAAWGWQTRAWSGGRVSSKAALLQQIGYVYPGGVQCDRNTVLQDDWGQWPYQGDDDVTPEEHDTLMALYPLLARGEIDGKPEPSHRSYSTLGLRDRIDAVAVATNTRLDALAAKVAAIPAGGSGGTVDPAAVAAALDLDALAAAIAAHIQLKAV